MIFFQMTTQNEDKNKNKNEIYENKKKWMKKTKTMNWNIMKL